VQPSEGEAVCISAPQYSASLLKRPRKCLTRAHLQGPILLYVSKQLVAFVAKGLTNKEIASHLNLSEFTMCRKGGYGHELIE